MLVNSVWQDVGKFRHFGNILQVFVKFLTVYFLFGKIANLFWQICFISGLIFLLQMGKYWNII